MLTELCSKCKYYLKIDLKAQEWETTKLRCKAEARYCSHEYNGNISYYCEKQESIIKNSANGGKCVPTLDMITNGKCPKHADLECYFKSNCWGDEKCDNMEKKEEPAPTSEITNLNQLEQYLADNNIKSVERVRGKLLIEFNQEQQARQEQPPK